MTTMRDLARHLAIIISTLCVIAMWIVAGSLYPKLPAKIPLHFNLSGVPDSYGPPNFTNWFLLPVIATLLAVFLLGISALIPFLLRFAPEIVNIPRKQELLALPADAQRRAIQPLTMMMAMISFLITLLFIQILCATERIANGAWETLPSWPLLVLIPSILAIVVWGHIAIRRRITLETTIQLVINHSPQ